LKNNDNEPFTSSGLTEARTRWVGSVRHLMLGLDPARHYLAADNEPIFMGGDPLDGDMLQVIAACMEAGQKGSDTESELVYVEFGGPADASEPRAAHVILLRDSLFLLLRNCRLWVGQKGGAALISPHGKGGHFVHEDGELTNVPGLPARSLAPGFARARKRLRACAAAMPDEPARHSFDPVRRAA